jgi:enamine deaminase RidA (YjgF/YER057c/UK114 family)
MTRRLISSGTAWEPIVGYSRLVQVDRQLFVSGTTAVLPEGGHAGDGDAGAQTEQAIRNIEHALRQVGAGLDDVVRTRLYVVDIRRDWVAVGRAHGQFFGTIRPATAMVEVSRLIEDWMLVEIEADAVLPSDSSR